MGINELINKKGVRLCFIYSETNKLYVYIKRCTLEAKDEYNFNTNAHRVEIIDSRPSPTPEQLKKDFPNSDIINLPSSKLKRFVLDYIKQIEEK